MWTLGSALAEISFLLFLSKRSIETAKKQQERQESARFPEDGLPLLAQLRGVYTHFNHASTFFSARMSHLLKELMPVTVFTLGETDPKYKAIGNVLEDIARAMFDSRKVVIRRAQVKEIERHAKQGGLVAAVKSLLNLFGSKSELEVLGNTDLEAGLKDVVRHLKDVVRSGNEKVVERVKKRFV